MASPDNPFGWFDVNAGYVVAAPFVTTGTISNANGTITGLAANATVVQGQIVNATSITLPSFVNAAVTNSGTIVLNRNGAGSVSGQTITVQNYPVLIGGEFSATLTAGSALTSSFWRNTGIVLTSDVAPNANPGTPISPVPGGARFAEVAFISGGSVTPAAGGSISGWFLRSIDGGTTFESEVSTPGTSVAALSRPPDFIIPLDNAAFAAGNIRYASGDIELPPGNFKTLIQNNSGATLPTNCAIIAFPKDTGY